MALRFVTPVLLLTLPLLLFVSLFHPATLDIGNAGWLLDGSDAGENALGAHAYWHDHAAGASLRTTLLNAPEGVPVLFTDSNPLVTLVAKPFAAWLPADAQLVGPFILLSLILQTLFTWLLLRRHAPGRIALWAGVVLLAFPPTLMNRAGHVNLMAHWTILAALYLFLDTRRHARWPWWAALIAVSALTHSYLLILVGAIWASAILSQWVDGRPGRRPAILAQVAGMLALGGMLAWWLGVGGQAATGYFGRFSMPLDALWNPGAEASTRLIRGHEASPGRGFEGFQYLGAGGLLLVAAALGVARYRPSREGERVAGERLRVLVPALVALAVLAIARLPLPPALLTWLDPVRASGRLFWPVGYVLILMAVLAVFRLSAHRAAAMLLAVVAIQAIDLSGMVAAIRARSQAASAYRLYTRTTDPRWDQLIARSRAVVFLPGDVTRDLELFQEVAWRAIDAGRPVANVYAARNSRVSLHRLAAEEAALARASIDRNRLYILLPGARIPASLVSRIERVDGVDLIAPGLAAARAQNAGAVVR
ncbi:hypothetical protein FHT00_000067 [Sphingomonas insulae]|uniref:DUF6311 domain-containing protein n=1 Tax=Sphingomonas insulae TaxID=424800 RepID=UPI0013D0F22F|nr:hypothetical protein [Sphingomonas insulae]